MKVYLKGHDLRFAVEESIISLMGEKPESVEEYRRSCKWDECGEYIVSSLAAGEYYITSVAIINKGGRKTQKSARILVKSLEGNGQREKIHLVRRALYMAITAHEGMAPPWGSLSGVRPSKLAMSLIERQGEKAAGKILRGHYSLSAEKTALVLKTANYGLHVKNIISRYGKNSVSLYVGIPFCPSRCYYCSFVSNSVEKSGHMIEPYVAALLEEIRAKGAILKRLGIPVMTVYIGGGTPTTLSAEQLGEVMGAISDNFDLSNILEYTVEAGRPDTITGQKLEILKAGGCNRISINPQTMSAGVLEKIGRRHSVDDVYRTFEEARRTGFKTINMDLIAGLDGDAPETFAASLRAVLTLKPENITVHTLALKKGSGLSEQSKRPESGSAGEMLEISGGLLEAGGYLPYYLYRQKYMAAGHENTGWSLPGHECIYNVCMMEEIQNIVSLGAGGVTKLVGNGIGRISNSKYPGEYIQDAEKRERDAAKLEQAMIMQATI